MRTPALSGEPFLIGEDGCGVFGGGLTGNVPVFLESEQMEFGERQFTAQEREVGGDVVFKETAVANDEFGFVFEVRAVFNDLADLVVRGDELVNEGGAVLQVDEGALDDDVAVEGGVELDGGDGGLAGFEISFQLFDGVAGRFWLGGAAGFEFAAFEGEAFLLDGEFLVPEVCVEDIFAHGLEVDEGAAEGAFGLGFVAVEEVQASEAFVGPMGRVWQLFMQFQFIGGGGALAASEHPAGVDRVVDEGGVLV